MLYCGTFMITVWLINIVDCSKEHCISRSEGMLYIRLVQIVVQDTY